MIALTKETKAAATLRLPEDRLKVIRAIARYENRSLADIFTELVDEYIERHRETLELLSIPGFVKEYKEGLEEIKAGGGKDIKCHGQLKYPRKREIL